MILLAASSILSLFGVLQQAAGPQAAPPAPPPTFRISGRVVDGITGQPLPRSVVSLNPSFNPTSGQNPQDSTRFQTTDSEGAFAFEGLAAGKYVLAARHRGYLAQMYQQHEIFTTAIVVGPDIDSNHLVFRLPPGGTISGSVFDESGDPIRHADVMLYRQMLNFGKRHILHVRQVSTDDEGRYRFSHLNPGTFFVAVSVQPWYAQHSFRHRVKQAGEFGPGGSFQPLTEENQALDVAYPVVFFPNANDLPGAAPIAVRSGDAAVADFHMQPVPALHVLVKTAVTEPDQGINLSLTQTVAENSAVGVSAQMNQIEPGLTEVTGIAQGRYNLSLFTQRGKDTTRHSQSVQLANDSEMDATQSVAAAVLSGALRMEDGSQAPQPARVLLQNLSTGEVYDTTVAATGEFSFKNSPVEPGNYELVIAEPQAFYIHSLSSQNVKTTGRSFRIETAQEVSVTINAAKGTGRITGFAFKKDKPASGVMVVLAPIDLKSNPALFRRDQSDSDGSFALNSVVPGRYTLMAIEDAWDLEWGDPDVLQKYVAGGESVKIAPNEKTEIQVKVQ